MNDQPIPQTIEADLIKIRTIKRKHIESLLEPVGTVRAVKAEDVEFLAYIHEHDAILVRRKDNDHLAVIRAIHYYTGLQCFAAQRDEAYALVHGLPQLFLD